MKLIMEGWQKFLTESGEQTLYHIGKRPPQPKPKRGAWVHKPGDEMGWDRPQHSKPVEAGVFLTPNPVGVAQNHGIFGNVYAYNVSNGLISKAGGMTRYEWGTEVLIPEDIWHEGIESGEIEFLGKSMDYDEFVKKADRSKSLGDRLATTKRRYPQDALAEGITDIVYHKTRLDQAAQILQTDKFMTSVAFGTPADQQQNKGKLYYLSTMRSPTGDYGPGLPAVTFKLDGRKLGERSKAAAVDYWGPDFPKDEMEDRVFTDDPYMEPATKYITEIHVGLPIGDKYRKMRPARLEEAETILAAGEGAGIPVFFYANEKTYGILNKTKRLTLDQWKQAFKKAGEELDEPWGYESGPYKPRLLDDVTQIIKGIESDNFDDIEKGYQTEWYNIKYDHGGERARQLKTAVHNSKSTPDAREYIDVIAKKVKKFGSVQGMIDWMQAEIKKWTGESELKQVAERYGFVSEALEPALDTRQIEDLITDKFSFNSLQGPDHRFTPGQPVVDYYFDEQKNEWKFMAWTSSDPEKAKEVPDLETEKGETLESFLARVREASSQMALFENWRKYLNEAVELDIEVGDIVLGGRYRNKRIVVKEVGKDALGQPTINGRPILKFRIEKHLPDSKKSKKTLELEKEEESAE